MSDSQTSSDIKINYQNNNGENLLDNTNDKKNLSTDTDYYYNKLVNPNKIIFHKKSESASSEILDITNTESSKKSINISTNDSDSNKSKSSKSHRSTNSKSDSVQCIEPIPIFINQSSQNIPSLQPPAPSSQNFIPSLQPPIPSSQNYIPSSQNYIPSSQNIPSQNIPSSQNTPSQNIPSSQNYIQQQFIQKPLQNIPPLQKEFKELTQQEIRMKKIEMLRRLSEIKLKGYKLSKEYDFNSSLEEMEYEYELLKSFADKRIGVKMYKNILLQSVSVIEFLNDKYDPFNFHLTGWSEHLSIETDNWDDTWEEIYEKYKSSGRKMAPEIKLLYLMIASASAFHFSKAHTSKLLGLDSVLASNPGLLSKIINPAKKQSQFMSPQEINIEKQKEELKNKEYENKINLQKQQEMYINQLQEQIKKQESMLNNYNNTTNINNNNFNEMWDNNICNSAALPSEMPPPISASELKNKPISIKAPEQVNAILNRIHNIQSNNIKNINTDTQDETSSNERLVSDTTLSDSKKKGRKSKPKSSIIIK